MRKETYKSMRIEPDRKWFGNIRTIDQKTMEEFNAETVLREKDPYSFLLKKRKVDYGFLMKEGTKKVKSQIESFDSTFGPKQQRNRPKLMFDSIEQLAKIAQEAEEKYDPEKDNDLLVKKIEKKEAFKETTTRTMEAGQSRRIWEELYKVIDSSDVIVMVLDARDPLGTMCSHAEHHITKNCKKKHIIYVLNKVDLIPTSVSSQWIKFLSAKHPTIAYKADLAKPFGRQGLMNLLRQFENFHKDKKTISVGFIGYPNVGKSSVINSLKKKTACKSAPIPGETKVWQYVSLTQKMYLIDCPGVVYSTENDTQNDIVLKGVVRAERIRDPDFFIQPILERVDRKVIKTIYKIDKFNDAEDFLTQLAIKTGKMRKKAEPDVETVARMVITDFQFGRLPHYTYPPSYEKNYFHKKSNKDEKNKASGVVEDIIGEENKEIVVEKVNEEN
jgi:nuclear GTP-binding protein